MSEYAIQVESVWKKFHRGEFHDSLRDFVPALTKRFLGRGPKRDELSEGDFWALKDVNFQVRRGEVLGIIGSNGAGKSTLLKILARIIKPNHGRVRVNGRLRALIEIAAGFHQDLTGRENIYLNGTIMGMKRREINAKFDQIVEFSGVGPFLDTPVKRYSSGMQARLGFAVAAHLDPEILLVDEVLAVGDAEFQAKCFNFIGDLRRAGAGLILISHNMHHISTYCDRCVVLDHGAMDLMGSTSECIERYRELLQGAHKESAANHYAQSKGSNRIRFLDVRLYNELGEPVDTIDPAEAVVLKIEYEAHCDCEDVELDLAIYAGPSRVFLQTSNRHLAQTLDISRGRGQLQIRFDALPANMQGLRFTVALWSPQRLELFDWHRELFVHTQGNAMSTGLAWTPVMFKVIPMAE